ncbi:MAG TPA: hypothetical protein VIW22_03750 [Nitrososphaerales archaeon]
MNGTKLRMLLLGFILIILGVAVYFTIGGEIRLIILAVAGVVFLVGSMVYPTRAKVTQ